jgi:hypothetical protein
VTVELEGRAYGFLIGGDVGRDGAYVEIADTTGGEYKVIAELFCPYDKQAMLLTLWQGYVPIEVIEEGARIARERGLIGR